MRSANNCAMDYVLVFTTLNTGWCKNKQNFHSEIPYLKMCIILLFALV